MGRLPIRQSFRITSADYSIPRVALFAIAAIGLGALAFASGFIPSPWHATAPQILSSVPEGADLERFERIFALEVQARKELVSRVEVLEARIADLTSSLDATDGNALAGGISAPEVFDSDETASAEPDAVSGEPAEASQFDDASLLALGADPRDIERLHDRWVDQQLEIASISNQALREGWFMQDRHRVEVRQSELALRQKLQDADYDRYLYALGRSNRIEAKEVLAGSAANEAGLRRGDIIIRYDDERLFSPGDLLVASSKGEVGRSVAMEILRDGQRETIYIRRGPLGVLMKPDRAPPLQE